MNRGNNMQQAAPQQGAQQQTPAQPPKKSNSKSIDKGLVQRVASVGLLFGITILLVALAASFIVGPRKEANFVDNDRMQAVFLNGGQVYFGKITDLNDKYLRMEDIFYLRVNQVVQPNQENTQQAAGNDISLVKLGCELHRPTNEMVINRSQIIFWENLKDEAGENTVPGAVQNYKAQFPDGQECQEANAEAGADAGAGQTAPAGTDAEDDTAPGADAGPGGLAPTN